MPIGKDDDIKSLLADGGITALTLDTNIFDAQQLNLKSPVFKALIKLKDLPFGFLLSSTVLREVQGHLLKSMEDSLAAVKKATGNALNAFDTIKPTRNELLDYITGGQTPADATAARLSSFVKDSNCEQIDDASLVDVATLFSAYFEGQPPFSKGKKAEFPDALALHALDRAAAQRQTGFLVVSEDSDWREFCGKSKWLHLVPKIEKALSLINNPSLRLRMAVLSWIADEENGRAEILSSVSRKIRNLDVYSNAHANSGDVETYAWDPEVHSIDWPNERGIDIIDIEELGAGSFRVAVSFSILVSIRVQVELNFSFWDSSDRESVSMGSRTIEVDREEEVQVTVNIEIDSLGEANQELRLVETEIDINSIDADLGAVDVFDSEDFDSEDFDEE